VNCREAHPAYSVSCPYYQNQLQKQKDKERAKQQHNTQTLHKAQSATEGGSWASLFKKQITENTSQITNKITENTSQITEKVTEAHTTIKTELATTLQTWRQQITAEIHTAIQKALEEAKQVLHQEIKKIKDEFITILTDTKALMTTDVINEGKKLIHTFTSEVIKMSDETKSQNRASLHKAQSQHTKSRASTSTLKPPSPPQKTSSLAYNGRKAASVTNLHKI